MTPLSQKRMSELNYNDVNVSRLYRFFSHENVKKVTKFLFPILRVLFVIFAFTLLYLPVVLIAIQSVNSSSDPTSFGSLTLQWYGEIFAHRTLRNAIFNTLLVAGLTVVVSTTLGTLFAIGIYALDKKHRQKFIILNNIPLVNAEIVTGISLMLLFSLLLPIFPYVFGLPTMLTAHIFFTLPYVVLSVLPKLAEIDPNLYDAAVDLGDSPLKALAKVIVPAILPGILSGAMLAFTMSIDDFVISYYTTGNGFDNISIWIYASIGRTSLKPAIYAFSTSMTLFATLVIVGIMVYKNWQGRKEKRHEK